MPPKPSTPKAIPPQPKAATSPQSYPAQGGTVFFGESGGHGSASVVDGREYFAEIMQTNEAITNAFVKAREQKLTRSVAPHQVQSLDSSITTDSLFKWGLAMNESTVVNLITEGGREVDDWLRVEKNKASVLEKLSTLLRDGVSKESLVALLRLSVGKSLPPEVISQFAIEAIKFDDPSILLNAIGLSDGQKGQNQVLFDTIFGLKQDYTLEASSPRAGFARISSEEPRIRRNIARDLTSIESLISCSTPPGVSEDLSTRGAIRKAAVVLMDLFAEEKMDPAAEKSLLRVRESLITSLDAESALARKILFSLSKNINKVLLARMAENGIKTSRLASEGLLDARKSLLDAARSLDVESLSRFGNEELLSFFGNKSGGGQDIIKQCVRRCAGSLREEDKGSNEAITLKLTQNSIKLIQLLETRKILAELKVDTSLDSFKGISLSSYAGILADDSGTTPVKSDIRSPSLRMTPQAKYQSVVNGAPKPKAVAGTASPRSPQSAPALEKTPASASAAARSPLPTASSAKSLPSQASEASATSAASAGSRGSKRSTDTRPTEDKEEGHIAKKSTPTNPAHSPNRPLPRGAAPSPATPSSPSSIATTRKKRDLDTQSVQSAQSASSRADLVKKEGVGTRLMRLIGKGRGRGRGGEGDDDSNE